MSPDDDRGNVTVEVTTSKAFLDLLEREVGDDVNPSEWFAKAAELQLRKMMMDDDSTMLADIPPEAAERAELLAEHSRVHHNKRGMKGSRREWLADVAAFKARFPDETEEDEE